MKDDIDLDSIAVEEIAIRRFSFQDDGANREIIVKIGKPERFPDYSSYFCAFEISGIENRRIEYAVGVDAVQALQLVMVMIGAKLKYLRDHALASLTWEGDPNGGFGFPETP